MTYTVLTTTKFERDISCSSPIPEHMPIFSKYKKSPSY